MVQTLIAVFVAVGVVLLYLVVRRRGTGARGGSGHEAVPGGRTVRVNRLQQNRSVTVKTPDGQERTYRSLDEMPAELRAKIEQARREGPTQTRTYMRVTRDGETREYMSERELPPQLRERLENIRAGEQGITIEVDGETHHYDSPDDVPPHLRKFLRHN